MVVNSSSILTQNDELKFLESNTKEIILVKDTNGSFFAEGFLPPLPQRLGSRTANKIKAFNPGSVGREWGSDSSDPSSENLDGSCPSNPTPKFPYQLSPNNQNQKKKKKNSIETKIVNDQIILRVIRDDMPFFIDEITARKKIYYASDFCVALPDNLDLEYVKSLSTKIV